MNWLPVGRVVLLFPFLMRPALLGRLILHALSSRWVVRLGMALLRRVPRRLGHWIAVWLGAAELAPDVVTLVESPEALGCVNMAVREGTEIASRTDAEYLFGDPLFRDPAAFACFFSIRDP
jgi:hypothetical protein